MGLQKNISDVGSDSCYEAPDVSLGRRVRKGGVWVFWGRIIQRALSLIRIIVLARLISPTDFGLFGIALLALSTLDRFSRTGFGHMLIQKRGDTRPYLDTAWTIGIVRGISIAAVLFGVAPLVARFFNTASAEPVLRVMGLAIVVQSLSNITTVYFEKELEFHKYFAYQIIGAAVDLIVAVGAAYALRSVWALVFGCLAGNLARCAASYALDSYRPHLRLDPRKAGELFGFGKWIFGSSILVFLLTQGDDIVVGKLLGATMLAFYQMAYRISNVPATEYSHLISTVMFPAYSKLQESLDGLREAYLKVLQLTAFLSIPMAGLVFALAPDFTRLFLGQKWMPIVPAMRVLALYGALRAIGATTGVFFLAVGKPQIRTKIQSAQLVLLAVLIYPLTARLGMVGAAIAVTAYAFILNFVAVYEVLAIVGSDLGRPAKVVVFPVMSSLAMIGVIAALRSWVFAGAGILPFILLSGIGISAYLLVAHVSDMFFGCGGGRLVREQFRLCLGRQGRG